MISRKSRILGGLILAVIAFELVSFAGNIGVARSAMISNFPISPNVSNELNLNITLTGGGATFPAPLIFKWATAYHAANPNTTITYASKGSGAGQGFALNKTADFGASDAPLSTRQRNLYPGILHIPETIGSVTASYNLPTIKRGVLNLNGTLLAKIYLNNITMWNDPQIVALNPSITLPAQPIQTVHRLDSSGTTFVFTSFLSADSSTWKSTIGANTAVNWPPGGIASNGNGGVANTVNSTLYSIGYVELQYADHGNLTYAKMQNPAGNFILPTLQSTTFAVQNSTGVIPASSAADWSGVSMLNAAGSQTYPIASFTYLLVYREMNVVPSMDFKDKVQFKALVKFLNWAVTTGQSYSSALTYVPLPPAVVAIDQAGINSMTYTEVSTPASRNILLHIGAAGWNDSIIGPPITINTGDRVTINFNSTDNNLHRFYIDFNNNGIQDLNETNVAFSFSTRGSNPYTFVPSVLNQSSIPAVGTYTYRDVNTGASGSITILPQQIPAVFTAPAVDINKKTPELFPTIDTSRVGTVGSLIIDMRTNRASGNVTVVDADIASSTVTFTKTYTFLAPGQPLVPVTGQPGLQLRFCLNINVASPEFALSSNVLIQLTGTTATTSTSLTRELDPVNDGIVDAVDLSAFASAYGTSTGQAGFNPLVDFGAHGIINIIDMGPMLGNFDQNVYR